MSGTPILQKLKRKVVLTSSGSVREKVYTISVELYVDKAGLSWNQVVELENGDAIDLHLTEEQSYLLDHMNGCMAIRELLELVGRSNRTKFREQILALLLKLGLIEMTILDKPTSSK